MTSRQTEDINLQTIPHDIERLSPPQQRSPWYKTIIKRATNLRLRDSGLFQDGQISLQQQQPPRSSNESWIGTKFLNAGPNWIVKLSSAPLQQVATTHDLNGSLAADAKRAFILAVTDQDVNSMIFGSLCVWYTTYLESKIRENWKALFYPVLFRINDETEPPTEDPTEKELSIAFRFITAVVSEYKTNGLTLMGICDELDNSGLLKGDKDVERIAAAQLVFSIVGWTSFLYSPKSKPDPEYLRIINPSSKTWAPTTFSRKSPRRNKSKTFNSFKQTLDFKDQPLFLLLNGFGGLIPKHHRDHVAVHDASGLIPKPDGWIEVSLLCFRTLNKFASIEIEWVDNLALHLEFDSSKKRLKLFQYPSACLILGCSSDTSVLAQLLLDYADSTDVPGTEEAIEYFKEVLLSYRLMFGQDKSSYQAFNKQAKKQKQHSNEALNRSSNGSSNSTPTSISRRFPDPLLPKICGSNWNSDGVKDLWDEIGADYPAPRYSPNNDFPFLGKRLLELQNYVRAQHPNSIKALWNDRRNLSWWWTFWAVIIIGGATLILGFLQVALQILQVIVSKDDNNQQPHKGLR